MILHTNHYEIERIVTKEIKDEYYSSADYIICCSDVADSSFEARLINKGYRFLDRILCFEIKTSAFKEMNLNLNPEVSLNIDKDYDERVYNVAFKALTNDRRFHLNPIFDQNSANDVIEAYIRYCKDGGFKIFKAVHENDLLGFAIVNDTDRSINSFENVLGATIPGIKGKMIAGTLYKFMIMNESDSFSKYVGRVSSSNVASINLHIALGGRVKKIYDEFILDNR